MRKIADNQKAPADEAGNQQHRKSGRAVFSDDGRSTWEWQTSTGVFSQDISDEQLGRLEAPHLELVDSSPAAAREEWTQTSDRLKRSATARDVTPNRTRSAPAAEKGKLRRLLKLVAGIN